MNENPPKLHLGIRMLLGLAAGSLFAGMPSSVCGSILMIIDACKIAPYFIGSPLRRCGSGVSL